MSVVIQNISKHYGKQLALNDVSFSVNENELVGFLGPNGAGKSTLMKIITGFLPADSGSVSICGLPVEADRTDFKRFIGYLPEHNPLYLELYVREYLEIASGFYGMKKPTKRISEIMEMTGLMPEGHKKIGALSKGYRQRVGIAQALLHDPKVVILDEPTSGLDPNQLDEIRELIKSIAHQKTVILSTHIMQEVEALCSRIVIINQGQIVADGSTEAIKHRSSQRSQQIYLETNIPVDAAHWQALDFVNQVIQLNPTQFRITANGEKDIRIQLFDHAVSSGIKLQTLQEETKSIESVFRELTK